MIKLFVLSIGRVDWNIWRPILKTLNKKKYKFNIIATAMHFEKKYGISYKLILRDGFKINHKIKFNFRESNPKDINYQISKYVEYFTNIFKNKNIDFLLVIGDRFETLAATVAATSFKIPIIHFHGGEITEGSLDNQYRNAITKLSHIHLVSNSIYKKRIIQLGEEKWRVKLLGAPALHNLNFTNTLDKKNFFKKYSLNLYKEIFLVNFNSESINFEKTIDQIKVLFKALVIFKNKNILVTDTNFDNHSNVISKYINNMKEKFNFIKVVKYLGEDYVSAMRYSKVMIGNSSSGVIEAASFKLPVINIGLRQKGRMMPKNVINTSFDKMKIIKSIKYSQSKEFLKKIKNLKNPYENKNFSNNLKKIFSDLSIIKKNKLIAKKFIDLKI